MKDRELTAYCGLYCGDWAPYPLIYHGGSNEMNLAHIWIDTKRDFAMVAVTNIGGQKANEALFALARELYTKYMKEKEKLSSKLRNYYLLKMIINSN